MPRRLLSAALPLIAAMFALTACQSDPASPPAAAAPGAVGNVAAPSPEPTVAAQTVTHAPARPARTIRYLSGQPLPNARLTPGEAFHGVGPSTFCVSGYTSQVRHVTDSMRQQVFAEYHISYAAHSSYEVDHLIPLELGGDNSLKNLWPEKGAIPNPKDGLENQLHNLVCHGQLSTATAQRAIATNWVTALSTYGSSGSVYQRTSSTTTTTRTTAPAPNTGTPTGATAKCVDGTYSYAVHHQGACSHHGGVAVWYR